MEGAGDNRTPPSPGSVRRKMRRQAGQVSSQPGDAIETTQQDSTGAEKILYYIEYTYANGLLTQRNEYVSLDGKFVLAGKYIYDYNDKGQLVKQEVLRSNNKPERTSTYEYNDDSTNPVKIDTENFLSNKRYTRMYEYEDTPSPLVSYYLIRGSVDYALPKKNIKKVTSPSDDEAKEGASEYTYVYNEKNWPVKWSNHSERGDSTIFEFTYQ